MQLLFGPSGIPLSTENRNTVNGIARVRELGLDAMEMAFVHSVNISEEKAPEVKTAAKQHNIVLTCHAPYYINLNAENPKREQSAARLLLAAKRLSQCGGVSVAFHAGFYQGQNAESVYKRIKGEIKEVVRKLNDEGVKIWIRPEISGKPTQFGNLEEVIRLSEEIDQVMPCIDFAHLHARTNGKYNSYDEFTSVLTAIEKRLGKPALQNMHIQVAGINYSEKGEKNHMPLQASDLRYVDLVMSWKDYKIGGVVITESPLIEEDTLLLKKNYEK